MSGYSFDEAGVRRIQRAVRTSLGSPKVGAQRRRQPPVFFGSDKTERVVYAADSCGGCTVPDHEMAVDLGGGLMASSDYRFAPFCADWVIFRFVYDTGDTWEGIADTEEVECTPGVPTSFTATLVASGKAPGEVVATVSDGTNEWTFVNEAAWQPDQPIELIFKTGPLPCPCAPFRGAVCLIPIAPVVEP